MRRRRIDWWALAIALTAAALLAWYVQTVEGATCAVRTATIIDTGGAGMGYNGNEPEMGSPARSTSETVKESLMPSHSTPPEEILAGLMSEGVFRLHEDGSIWRCKVLTRWGRRRCSPRRAERHCRDGYLQLETHISGRRMRAQAHRVVWVYANGPIDAGMEINHKNGIRSDNRPSNLEVVTRTQNIRHAVHVLGTQFGQIGGSHRLAKLSEEDVLEIRRLRESGMEYGDIAGLYQIHPAHACNICRRKCWRHV